MTLRDFLKQYASVGAIVVIRDGGWQIGLTRIDNDELYLYGLNPILLNDYEIVNFAHETRDWATVDVLVVDILLATEVSEYIRERMV